MKKFKDLEFRKFNMGDIELFTKIMKRAFDKDTQIHLHQAAGGPPGYDTGEFLRKWALHKASTAFTIYKDDIPIGATIVWINANNENFLGTIFLDPDYQEKGIGLSVWNFIEQEFPETKIWRTETPGFSKRNHHFYVNKCGFKIVKIEDPKDELMSSYKMEKEMI